MSYSIALLMLTTCTADIHLTTSFSRPIVGRSFTFTCTSNLAVLTFNKGAMSYCTLGLVDGECKLDPVCPTQNTYSCNRNLQTYTLTVTIDGSLVTDSLHESTWNCNNPFGGGQSNEVELYVYVPITQATVTAYPVDNNPVEIVTDTKQKFHCQTDAGRPSSRIQWYISGINISSFAIPQFDVCPPGCNGKVKSSSVLLYNVNRGDDNKRIYCTAQNFENQSVRSHNRTIVILYGPHQVIISPSTQTYTVTEITGRVGPITCSADCKPKCTTRWSGPNLSVSTTSVLYLENINRNQTGNYQCSCANIVGSLASVTISVFVYYGPNQVNISPTTQMYTVIESSGSIGPITCSAECKPDCTMTWSGPNVPIATTSVLHITNVKRNHAGNYQCSGENTVGRLTSVNINISVHYFPNIHMEPIYNPYIVYHNQRDAVLICVIDDANPSKAVTYEWNSPSGTINTQNFTIPTVTKLHSGLYSCTASNIAGTSNKATKQLNVHYGPMLSNISIQYDITEGNSLIVSPIVDANPVSKLVWWTKQNDANFRYDGFVLRINNINRMSSGNYSCYVMNTLAPSGMLDINKTTQQTFSVNVVFKPFLDSTKPYSPGHITAAINSTLRLTLTIIANPVPTIEWTFRADKNWNSCNFVSIVSNTTSNEFFTTSSVLLNNVISNNFGDYVFTARNTVGVFSRRFVAMEEASLRQEMFASTKENTGMFLAGVVILVVGLLSLMASVLFIFYSLKNKTRNSSKTNDYSDVQRSNPTFTDPYTTLQSDIETRASQEQIVNTYEECGRYPEAHAYSSVDNIESEQSQHQQHSGNTYEECGKRIEAHACDNLNK